MYNHFNLSTQYDSDGYLWTNYIAYEVEKKNKHINNTVD